MARYLLLPPESFEDILAWLNPDRELAGQMYVQLRHDLEKLFTWRGCSDPEGLTDEVFDRVAKKIHVVRPTYEGDPRFYFRAVANNLVKENYRQIKTHASLKGVESPIQQTPESRSEDVHHCLQVCLQELSTQKRDLIIAYYAKEKQAKIDHRRQLAQEYGVSVETLRVRIYRIGVLLAECIERCLKQKSKQN